MQLRTDLVMENDCAEMCTEQAKNESLSFGDCSLDMVHIDSPSAAKNINKPRGKYYTLRFNRLDTVTDTSDIKNALIYSLKKLLPENERNGIMIVGLGNSDITPDALGPLTANRIMATRHISKELKENLGLQGLKTVSVLIPGVIGKTGIESSETVKAAVRFADPSAIIAIDALAARYTENLCRTIQLCDSGISPGSGVSNARKELSKKTLDIPVIAIGMPTVTDTSEVKDMMVTPKEIDILIKKASEIIADALNIFLQPGIDSEIIAALA